MGNYYSRGPAVKEDKEIDISYQKLTALPNELVQEIYDYVHLQSLNASNNALTTLAGIKRLATLIDLNLEHNNLKQLHEDIFQLVLLQRLNLSYNQLVHIPEDIRCLKNLKELKCDNNRLSSISSEVYHLSNLTLLNLSHNQLDIFPLEISLLANLRHLDLYANRIPLIPASAFAQCAQLTHINLSHNALRELPARVFDSVPQLVKLYASHNQLRQLPNLDRLTKLRELDVSYNKLDRVPQFKQRLTFLDISHNPATAGQSRLQDKEKEKVIAEDPINFNTVPEKGKRLFHITGHSYTQPIIYMMEPELRLPDMGYYMLDNSTSLLLWEAHRCSPATREAVFQIVKAYAKEFNIREVSYFNSANPGIFWQQLQMQNPFATARAPLPKKRDYYLEYVMKLKLFCFAEDLNGEVYVDLQAGKRPYHHQLDSACCYVLDSGWDVFVWAGSESSAKLRQQALLKSEELMDCVHRVKLSSIQWEFEGEEKVLFKEQFLNWDEAEVQVDIPIPVRPISEQDKTLSSLKKRHDSLVKQPDAEFGTFPEIKIVQSKKKRNIKKPKIVISKAEKEKEKPPSPEKAKLVPELPLKTIQQVPPQKARSMLSFAERPAIPRASRAPSANPIRDRQTRHLAHEKVSPRNSEKSPRGGGLFVGGPEDLKKIQLKSTGVALYGEDEGKNSKDAVGPRLIQFQGRRSFLGKRLQPINTSIVLGSAYLLDTGKHGKLYIWADKTASRTSKGAALALAKALRDKERPDSLVINIEVGGDDTEFWKELGGKIPLANIPADDAAEDTTSRDHIFLHKVRNTKEGFQLTTEASGSLKKEFLESTGCYLLDAETEIYVWFGKQAPKVDKEAGIKFAEEIEKEKQAWCAPISKEYEFSEQVLFKEKFVDWGGSIPISMQQVPVGMNVASPRKQVKIDVNQMLVRKPVKEEPMVDDGTGKIKIWRVEDYEKSEKFEGGPGSFYVGDAYVILYTYIWKNVERYIIYFYQGRDATINDAGAAALLTVGLDDQLNRQAKEVRVVQGKEPKHFLTMFKGKIMLHQGQDPCGEGGKKYEEPALYDVRGNDDLNIKAIQVFPSANMLNHCHVFILLANRYQKDGPNFIWCGNKSNDFERNFAKNILQEQGYTKVQVLEQGRENDVFWDLLGGKDFYYDKNPTIRVSPRIFQCSEASGITTIEEIVNFYQDDLDGGDVMILDAYSEMYVWAGKMSTEGERKAATQLCIEYAAAVVANEGRPKDITCYYMREGDETLQFTTHFQGYQWQPRHRMSSMVMPNPLDYPPVLKPLKLVSDLMDQLEKTYSYQDLLEKKYPKGLDGSKLESYMTDKEFEEVFAVTKQEFEVYPLWKKEGLKKDLGLF
jgi:Leucine-rich repeat (LRR) protein